MLTPLTAAALFLVVTIDPGAEDVVRDLLADLSGLERTVGFRVPTAGLALVTGIGSDAWSRLFAGPGPPSSTRSCRSAVRGIMPTPPRGTCCSTSAPPRRTCASSWPP